jgi:fructose-bisphosphate aldolase class I
MLKLTLPDQDDFYSDLISHPRVVRVVALSGGYSQEGADDLLRRDHGMLASFSRALLEGLSAQQSDAEFNAVLEKSIQRIYDASTTKQTMIEESDGNRMTRQPQPQAPKIITERDSRYGQG